MNGQTALVLPLVFSGINPLANSESCCSEANLKRDDSLEAVGKRGWSLGGAALIAEVGGKYLSLIGARSSSLGSLSIHTCQDSKERNCKPSFLFESVCDLSLL